MKFTSVLALVLTIAALIALVMTVAAPKSPNIAAHDSIYRPALWKVY